MKDKMRRPLSIILILCFILGPLSATLQADNDSRLPVCCRRGGAHHCSMNRAMRALLERASSSTTPAFADSPRCPFFPGHVNATVVPFHALARSRAQVAAPALHICALPAFASLRILAPARDHNTRGPPLAPIA